MNWSNVDPDIEVPSVSHLLMATDWIDAIHLICQSVRRPLVAITCSCRDSLYAHCRSSPKEIGGLLIGRAFYLPYGVTHGYGFVTCIMDSVPSMEFKNSPVSLTMETEIWGRVGDYFGKGKMVIGWYHTHPHLGAFFSSVDRSTQAKCFNSPYCLGVVIDPSTGEIRCYCGPNSDEISHPFDVIAEELAFSNP